MYLIINRNYQVACVDKLDDYILECVDAGMYSVINCETMRGMNHRSNWSTLGMWSDIPRFITPSNQIEEHSHENEG